MLKKLVHFWALKLKGRKWNQLYLRNMIMPLDQSILYLSHTLYKYFFHVYQLILTQPDLGFYDNASFHLLTAICGFSCARAAADMGSPIAILNIGPTRADDLAFLKIEKRSGEVSITIL